jgi:hypothetical protein
VSRLQDVSSKAEETEKAGTRESEGLVSGRSNNGGWGGSSCRRSGGSVGGSGGSSVDIVWGGTVAMSVGVCRTVLGSSIKYLAVGGQYVEL